MKLEDEILIEQILGCCDEVETANNMFNNDKTLFIENVVYRNATCMSIFQIGELCKRISDEFKEENSKIPWKDWAGIRDIFAHRYANLNLDIAWGTIQNDLPILKEFCEESLKFNKK